MDEARYSDAARRCADQIRLHLAADREQAIHSWVAIRLSDGGSDGILYNLKKDAVRHQFHEFQCMYLKIPANGLFTAQIAERLLEMHRQLYDAGMRLADPDADLEVVVPMNLEHLFR